jgi:hypothetical protein
MHDDGGPFARQRLGNLSADPTTAPGHQRHLASKLQIHTSPPLKPTANQFSSDGISTQANQKRESGPRSDLLHAGYQLLFGLLGERWLSRRRFFDRSAVGKQVVSLCVEQIQPAGLAVPWIESGHIGPQILAEASPNS